MCSSHSSVGSLELALRAGVRWGPGMSYLGMIHRVEQTMNSPEDYAYLLTLCRTEILKSGAQDVLVQ